MLPHAVSASGEMSLWAVLPYAIATLLTSVLTLAVVMRRPPSRLWPVLLLFQGSALLFLAGDTLSRFSTVLWVEELGLALLYSGAIAAAASSWVLSLRYAEAQGRPFPWAGPGWVRVPVGLSVAAWGVAITNPLHGQLLTPVVGGPDLHHWAWWGVAFLGFGLVTGALLLNALLGWSSEEGAVRRNGFLMTAGFSIILSSHLASYATGGAWPFDPTVVGLAAASALFLYGAYRTRLFCLLPPAVVEPARHDPSALVLVDLEGGWLRSNPAAAKLLGPALEEAGRDVVSLLACRLRSSEDKPLSREDLVLRLLQGPRARHEVVGPLRAGDGHWVEITATPIPRSERRARAVSLRIQDVSARVSVEEQLRRARRELANQAGERRTVDALLGEILRDLSRAATADDPGCVRGLIQRARRSAEQARVLSGAVVHER